MDTTSRIFRKAVATLAVAKQASTSVASTPTSSTSKANMEQLFAVQQGISFFILARPLLTYCLQT
jgi:hypothetical protein